MISEKFSRLIEALNISKVSAAKELGVTKTAISDITNGRVKNLSGTMIELLKVKFRVNPEYWTEATAPMFLTEPKSGVMQSDERLQSLPLLDRKVVEDMISILTKRSAPVVQQKLEAYSHSEVREIVELGSVAAGPLTSEEVTAGKKIQFPRALIPERGPLYALRVRGDSMIGANIHDGDYAIIRPVPQPQELKAGTIVVALVNGENTLKRLYRADHGATLRAANDRYPDIQVTKFQDLVIQGELRYLLKRVGE